MERKAIVQKPVASGECACSELAARRFALGEHFRLAVAQKKPAGGAGQAGAVADSFDSGDRRVF